MRQKNSLTNLIENYLCKNELIKGDGVCLAVSGGADSVAMLLIFCELKNKFKFNISVRHFEHGIRGEESKKDALFVESLCNKLGIPITVGSADVPSYASEKGISTEEAARILRYEFLAKTKMPQVATAHNLNDNVETFLFNLARGSGLRGLAGIPREAIINDKRIIRPMLCAKRADIEKYILEAKQEYCIDSTNSDKEYTRNYIRLEIVPKLCELNSKALEHINSASGVISEACKKENQIADNFIACNHNKEYLDIRGLKDLDNFTVTSVLHNWIRENSNSAKDVGAAHIEALRDLIRSETGKKISLPGFVVEKSYNNLYIHPSVKVEPEGIIDKIQYRFNIFSVISSDILSEIPKYSYTKWFDYDKITNGFCLRLPKDGDYFTINANLEKKPYNRFCIDNKIPKEERQAIPLLTDGSHIIWAIGYRISEYYKVCKQTKTILEVSVKEI